MSLTRKQFLSSMIGVVAGAAGAAVLVGCGGSDSGGADAGPPNCSANGTRVTIGDNHNHAMAVSKDEVAAGVEKTYDIKGTATHTHSVTISAALFTMLKSNTAVMTMSTTTDDHTHAISVSCN